MFTQPYFQLKMVVFDALWPFIYATLAFWGPENTNFKKSFKSQCKLQKYKFVKMLTDVVFLYKVSSPTTGLACIIQCFLSFSQIRVNILTTLSSVCKAFQKPLTFILSLPRITVFTHKTFHADSNLTVVYLSVVAQTFLRIVPIFRHWPH